MNFAYAFDKGKIRERNEDSAIVLQNNYGDVFMMVLDGIGGHNQGDIASKIAQQFLVERFIKKGKFLSKIDMQSFLRKSINDCNRYLVKLNKESLKSGKVMGTTLSCYLIHDDKVLLAYLGDSRAYLINKKKMKQLSMDETYVQYLYEKGKINKKEMALHPSRHVLTNAVGCYHHIYINMTFINEEFDYLLLCSDGLYNELSDKKMAYLIYQGHSLNSSCVNLIKQANLAGGKDNIALALYKKGDNL